MGAFPLKPRPVAPAPDGAFFVPLLVGLLELRLRNSIESLSEVLRAAVRNAFSSAHKMKS